MYVDLLLKYYMTHKLFEFCKNGETNKCVKIICCKYIKINKKR